MYEYQIDPDAECNRRKLLTAGAAAFTLPFPASTVFASTPARESPTDLEDLITRLTLVIYAGRLERQVWTLDETDPKARSAGGTFATPEKRLLTISEIDQNRAPEGFFEIVNAEPLLKNPSAISLPLHSGRIYSSGYSFPEGIRASESFVGKDLLFFFDGFRTGGLVPVFPSPLYATATGGHWRDRLPILQEKGNVILQLAKRAGFITPTSLNSVMVPNSR